jgi:hypothetical protein
MGFFKEVDLLWNEGKTPAEIAEELACPVLLLMVSFVKAGYLQERVAASIEESSLWASPVVYQDKAGRIFLPDGRIPAERSDEDIR